MWDSLIPQIIGDIHNSLPSNLLSKLNVGKHEHRGISFAQLLFQTILIEVLCLQQLNFQEAAVNNVDLC